MLQRRIARTYAVLLFLALLAGSAAAVQDAPRIAGFEELARRLRDIDGLGDATVLGAELFTNPERPDSTVWIVDVLTEDGDVEVFVFDARTLEERRDRAEDLAALRDALDDDGAEFEIFPIWTVMFGHGDSDWLEGQWSDDISTGGDGRDLFVLTPGNDVIMDFNPNEDVLDVGDFARPEFGFSILRSLRAIARRADKGEAFDRPALILDVDGEAGEWTTALIGVEIDDLTENNIFFGLDHDGPPVDLEFLPERTIVASNGAVVVIPAHHIDDRPDDPHLIVGDEDTLEFIFEEYPWYHDEER